MLTPTKSVTAVIGLSKNPIPQRARGCQTCSMNKKCQFRQKGGRCKARDFRELLKEIMLFLMDQWEQWLQAAG